MVDQEIYWNDTAITQQTDFMKQVGKTVNGNPITDEEFHALEMSIVNALSINRQDKVLDLCCGNGIVTHRIAEHCNSIVGVDFSIPLLNVAKENFNGQNIKYLHANICALPKEITAAKFTKIYMNEAFQYFGPAEAESILATLCKSASSDAPLLLASIPDLDDFHAFYDTPEKVRARQERLGKGTETIPHWWNQSDLSALVSKYGYSIEISPTQHIKNGVRYRFDALCKKY